LNLSWITPPNADASYRGRLRQYRRRENTILWVGAGLIGLIGLVTSDLTDGAPAALTASAATLIIVGGAALAWARIKFEWAATQVDRAIEDGAKPSDALPTTLRTWPEFAELVYYVGILSVPLAGLVYLAAVWWAVA
jgi:hypothetical protein